MSEVSGYQELVERAAYFRDADDPWSILQEKTTEEFAELLLDSGDSVRYRAILEGRVNDPDPVMRKHYVSEAGDVLYCLVASGLMEECNTTFEQMVGRAAVMLGGSEEVDDLAQFDEMAKSRMEPVLPPGYDPDYFGMQFFNVPPFISLPHVRNQDPEVNVFQYGSNEIPVPVTFSADGYYVIERTVRTASEVINAKFRYGGEIDTIPLAICALAVIGMNRFKAGLQEIVHHNTTKIERRLINNTVRTGDDPERSTLKSTQESQEATLPDGWSVTVRALGLA